MTQVKTVLDKLKIENYKNRLFLNVPPTVTELQDIFADYKVQQTQYDCIFSFVFSLEEFEKAIDKVVEQNLLAEEATFIWSILKKVTNTMIPLSIETVL